VIAGIPLFSNPEIARIILDALIFIQDENEVELLAYVIMENHIHCIMNGKSLTRKFMLFKSFTARSIVDLLKQTGRMNTLTKLKLLKRHHKQDSTYQVWQEVFHPKQIFSDEMMIQKITYMHDNPVKRGYVDSPEHWRYSSARNYLGLTGLIPVMVYGRDRLRCLEAELPGIAFPGRAWERG